MQGSQQTAWEVYDINIAGCKLCGTMHACSPALLPSCDNKQRKRRNTSECTVEKNSEGHEICTITGFCIKMLSFSDKEYLNATMNFSSACGSAEMDDHAVDDLDCPHHHHTHHHDSDDETTEITASSSKKRKRHAVPLAALQTAGSTPSVNKKNRYRSWVHQRIQINQQTTQTLHIMPTKRRGGTSATAAASGEYEFLQSCSTTADRVRSLIDTYVWEIICSGRWMDSMLNEVHASTAFVLFCPVIVLV